MINKIFKNIDLYNLAKNILDKIRWKKVSNIYNIELRNNLIFKFKLIIRNENKVKMKY